MNPLSPFTYYRRHKRHAALLLGLVCLATIGIYLMVGWLQSVSTYIYTSSQYLTRFSLVQPVTEHALQPTELSMISSHPDVERAFPENGLSVALRGLGAQTPFRLLGLTETDVPYVLEKSGAILKEGRMLQPRTNEVLLSEEIAAALGLRVGDTIGRSIDHQTYENIPGTMEVVGILAGDVRLGIVSYEYLAGNDLYGPRASGLMVLARERRKDAVDAFLAAEIRSRHTAVMTLPLLMEEIAQFQGPARFVFGVIAVLVAAAIMLVVGVINQMALARRLPEFGMLHAVGYTRRRLVARLALEATVLAAAGWLVGLLLSWLVSYLLAANVYAPRGLDLPIVAATPILFVAPIPAAVIGFTLVTAVRVFLRLDAIAVVERGELSLEQNQQRGRATSSPRPLTPWTFYRRHKRRAFVLAGTMALMIMAVAFLFFLAAAITDALEPQPEHLRKVSVVTPRTASSLDTPVVARIRTHPTVERVVPAIPLDLAITVSPFSMNTINVYGVAEKDMAYLVTLYDLSLKEGRLPHPHTNEIVLPETIAQNRGLQVGDSVGYPADERDEAIPTEMVVTGIFAKPASRDEEIWLPLVPFEFLERHEMYTNQPVSLLVVPQAGQKAGLDDWLEDEIASDWVKVQTYRQEIEEFEGQTRNILVLFVVIESMVTIVAAVALAVLNHIFVSQRWPEFGVLRALGYGQLRLLWRVVRETGFVVSTAWATSAALCLAGLGLMQLGYFEPRGLAVNFVNPMPWLFTLPIPLVSIAASAGTIAWMLSRLDPVAVIERR